MSAHVHRKRHKTALQMLGFCVVVCDCVASVNYTRCISDEVAPAFAMTIDIKNMCARTCTLEQTTAVTVCCYQTRSAESSTRRE